MTPESSDRLALAIHLVLRVGVFALLALSLIHI